MKYDNTDITCITGECHGCSEQLLARRPMSHYNTPVLREVLIRSMHPEIIRYVIRAWLDASVTRASSSIGSVLIYRCWSSGSSQAPFMHETSVNAISRLIIRMAFGLASLLCIHADTRIVALLRKETRPVHTIIASCRFGATGRHG